MFKVGRTTGLTYGEVAMSQLSWGLYLMILAQFGSVAHLLSKVLMALCFRIKVTPDRRLSAQMVGGGVGILYAGNGQQTYACPIDTALSLLNCSLA